jgi:GWxTD domain-containing protein
MKKLIIISLIALLAPFAGQSRNLWAFLTYSTFNSPEGPYVETYLTVAANSVKYIKQDNGKYRATVDIVMTFKENDTIRAFKKYELNSPEVDDTANLSTHFLDQQRFQVPNGTYTFNIELADKNKEVKPLPYSLEVAVNYPAGQPSVSDIELIRSYKKAETEGMLSKSGYNLVPYLFTFYPERETMMTFYCEFYNLDKAMPPDQKFLVSYYVEPFSTEMKLGDFGRMRKELVKPVNVLFADVDITKLASGNYNLVVEARNQKNEVIASKTLFFQRSNPNMEITIADFSSLDVRNTFVESITNIDTLKEYISSTYPIALGTEQLFIKNSLPSSHDLKTLQQFFLGFWTARNAADPQKNWLAYKQEVKIAQFNFGTPVKKGYQTDRGRVYLQYGPPNNRTKQYMEPASYPYEIWQYYSCIGNQTNRKFVFYAQDMVTSDFTLLHSDAKGEIYNRRWQYDLMSRTQTSVDLQETQTINSWGDDSKAYFDMPISN